MSISSTVLPCDAKTHEADAVAEKNQVSKGRGTLDIGVHDTRKHCGIQEGGSEINRFTVKCSCGKKMEHYLRFLSLEVRFHQ